MARIIFSIHYDVIPEKREEYLNVVKELKTLIKAEGLESYSVYENKNKENNFEEVYVFVNEEAYEEFDDIQDERTDILMTKLSDLIKQNSQKYNTFKETA